MSKCYLYAGEVEKDVMTHIFVEDGVRHVEKVRFKPFCGLYTSQESDWKDVHGSNVAMRSFDCISDYRRWKKESDGCFEVLGDIDPKYMFIASKYPGKIELDKRGMNVYNLDIEILAGDYNRNLKIKVRKKE